MSTCDCRICRYHDRPFEMGKCPHPKHGHRSREKWTEYIATEEGKANMRAHSSNPEYVIPADPFALTTRSR